MSAIHDQRPYLESLVSIISVRKFCPTSLASIGPDDDLRPSKWFVDLFVNFNQFSMQWLCAIAVDELLARVTCCHHCLHRNFLRIVARAGHIYWDTKSKLGLFRHLERVVDLDAAVSNF
jgi:hypothetical protein